jgi:multidrug transporter EmrE-like cation transporter
MNEAHLHLLLNHVPILGSLFGLVVLAVGLLRDDVSIIRTGLVTLLIAAVLCLPVQLTGEGAQEVLQGVPGTAAALIQAHEEAAELSFWVLELTGALAMLTLLQPQRTRLMTRLMLAGAIVSFALLAWAGSLGGQIRHPEARTGFLAPAKK